MANARLLVKRLKSVRNIRKITRTMELIATSRFKRAMDRATEAAEYTKKISAVAKESSRSSTLGSTMLSAIVNRFRYL